MWFITVQNKEKDTNNQKDISTDSSWGSNYADQLDAVHKQSQGYTPNSDKIATATTANEASTKAALDLAKSKDVWYDPNSLKDITETLQKWYWDIWAWNAAAINAVTEQLKWVQSNGESYQPAEQTYQEWWSSLTKAISWMKQVEGAPKQKSTTMIDEDSEKWFSVPEMKSISEEEFNKADLAWKVWIIWHNVLASWERIWAWIANTVLHPINTANWLMMLWTWIKDVISWNDSKEAQVVENLWKTWKYGSWDNFKKWLIEDPTWFITDALTVVSWWAWLAAKAWQLWEAWSTLWKIWEVAWKVWEVANAANPANVIAKWMWKIVSAPFKAVKEWWVAALAANAWIPKTVIDDIRSSAWPKVADALNDTTQPDVTMYNKVQDSINNMKIEKQWELSKLQTSIDSKSLKFDASPIKTWLDDYIKDSWVNLTWFSWSWNPASEAIKSLSELDRSWNLWATISDKTVLKLQTISDDLLKSPDIKEQQLWKSIKDKLSEKQVVDEQNAQIPEKIEYDKKYWDLKKSFSDIKESLLMDAKSWTTDNLWSTINNLFDVMKNNKSAWKAVLQSLNEFSSNKNLIWDLAAHIVKWSEKADTTWLWNLSRIALILWTWFHPVSIWAVLLQFASSSPVMAAKVANSLWVSEKFLNWMIDRINKTSIWKVWKALFVNWNQIVTEWRKWEQQIQDQTNTQINPVEQTNTNTQTNPLLPTNQ